MEEGKSEVLKIGPIAIEKFQRTIPASYHLKELTRTKIPATSAVRCFPSFDSGLKFLPSRFGGTGWRTGIEGGVSICNSSPERPPWWQVPGI